MAQLPSGSFQAPNGLGGRKASLAALIFQGGKRSMDVVAGTRDVTFVVISGLGPEIGGHQT